MPGKPQIWYLNLFSGKNDHAAVERAGAGGHKEINRTNLSLEEVFEGLERQNVLEQLDLIKFRNTFPAFGFEARLQLLDSTKERILMQWENQGCRALLDANLEDYTFKVKGFEPDGDLSYFAESII
jgi:sucrose phosphorylase